MKISVIVLFLSVFSLLNAEKAVLDATKKNGVMILEDNTSYLDLEYEVKDLVISRVTTEKGEFSSLTLENGYLTGEPGLPALPSYHDLVAMPYGAEPEVEILSYNSVVYKTEDLGVSLPLIPQQPSYSKSSDPEDRIFVSLEQSSGIQYDFKWAEK